MLGYADTQEHALYGTPDAISAGLHALSESGVSYVLLQLAADPQQLRRIAHDVAGKAGAAAS